MSVRGPGICCALGLCAAVLGCEAPVCGDGVRSPGALCFAVADARQTSWGFEPDTLRWFDVDGDGERDLIAASHTRGTVSVVWGADATLGGTATTWSVAHAVAGLAVADVDADGLVDVVTAVPDEDAVAVLRGTGGRTFAAAMKTEVGSEPRVVLAVDLDGDGGPELVTLHAGDGTVGVVRDGVVMSTVVGPGPRDMAAGDVDGDGSVDVVVALADRGALQVLLGDGAGGLMPGAMHAVGAAPYAVVVEDLDGDGAVDMASADALERTVSVLFGDGAGGVRGRAVWPTFADPRALVVVDQGEDLPVLAVLSHETDAVRTIDPRTGASVEGSAAIGASAIAAIDVDEDGRMEVLYTRAGQLGALRAGLGVQLTPLWEGEPASAVVAVDVDGDGVDELAVVMPREAAPTNPGELPPGLEISLLRDGVVFAEVATELVQLAAVLAADFDGDGRRELVVLGGSGGQVLQPSDDGFDAGPLVLLPSMVASAALGDADGDGSDEVLIGAYGGYGVLRVEPHGSLSVVAQSLADGAVRQILPVDADGDERLDAVLVVNGVPSLRSNLIEFAGTTRALGVGVVDVSGSMIVADFDEDGAVDGVLCGGDLAFVSDVLAEAPGRPVKLGESACSEVASGDVDGDGRMDVLALRLLPDRVVVAPWVYGDDGFSAWASQAVESGRGSFARFDADGMPDLLLSNYEAPLQAWRTGVGAGLVDLPLRRFGGVGLQFADLDGDSVLDMFNYGGGISVAFGDGDGGFGPMLHHSREVALAGGIVNSAAVEDFDGDGDEEVVLAVRHQDGWTTELRSVVVDAEGGLSGQMLMQWTLPYAQLASGDLDEDGAVDLVVFQELLGVQVMRGVGDGTFMAGEKIDSPPFALRGGRVVDVDGDGHRDFLGTLPSGLALHRGGGDGTLRPGYVWWTAAEAGVDRLAVGDVTRDGKPDVVVASALRGFVGMVVGGGDRSAGVRLLLGGAEAVGLADLEGDGQLEVLAAGRGEHQADGMATLYIGRGDAGGGVAFSRQVYAGAEPTSVSAVDFDGDGVLDVVVTASGEVTIVRQVP